MPGESARINGRRGGRPVLTKTLQTQILRTRLTQRFYDEADAIFTAWRDLALGHYIMVKNPLTGEQRVYKKGPNGMAIKDMVEQVLGKAKQTIEVNIPEDEPDYDSEALQRMGKYVEPTDAEFIELATHSPGSQLTKPLGHRATKIYQLPGVGGRPRQDSATPQKGLDQANAQK